jgi:hypothetical protein
MALELTQYYAFADARWSGHTIVRDVNIASDKRERQAVPEANSHAAPPFGAYTDDVPQHVLGMPESH